MSEKFDKIDYEIGQKLIGRVVTSDLTVAHEFYNGNHWLGGEGWIGPQPDQSSEAYSAIMATIQKNFISRNVVQEIVNRHVSSVMASDPYWKFTPKRDLGFDEAPNADESKRMVEAEALLQTWLDEKIMPRENDDRDDVLRESLAHLLVGGRSVLRIFVPPDELVNGQVPRGTMEESLERIFIHNTISADSCVFLDAASQRQVGIWRYEDVDIFDQVHQGMEFTYLTKDRKTVIRTDAIMGSDNDDYSGVSAPALLDLGGRLTMHEMRRPAIINEQVISLQKMLNLALTMWGRNTVLAGFLERVILNANIPKNLKVGAGTTYSLIGKEVIDQDGHRTLATPNVIWRDPVDVTSFRVTREAAYHSILEQVNMAHYTLTGDSRLSGESRRQSLSDYEKDLKITARAAEKAMRWLLETVLKMAAVFSGQPDRYDDLRVDVTISANPAITDPEVWLAIDQLVRSRMMSRETGMSGIGIMDIDSELNRIALEKSSDLWTALGVPLEATELPPPAPAGGVPNRDDSGSRSDSGGSGGSSSSAGAGTVQVRGFTRRRRSVGMGRTL